MNTEIRQIHSTLSLADAVTSTWDVLIVGAGPAGSMAARESAHVGLQTLLVDKSGFPRQKVCGGCLNLSALDILERVGLSEEVQNLGGQSIERIELVVNARKTRIQLPGGLSVSRHRFDTAILKAALDSGAQFLSDAQARINKCDDESRSVTVRHMDGEATIRARVVIVASGLSGVKMAETGFSQEIAEHSHIGASCLMTLAEPSFSPGTIYMACGRNGYVGVVCVEEGRLNVAAALDPQWVRQCGGTNRASIQLMEEAGVEPPPTLAEQNWLATPLLTRRAGRVAARRLLIVGDAAGYVEPFTGEGMAWALASGRAVVPVIHGLRMGWDAEMERKWTRVHRQLIRGRQQLCRTIAWWLRRPTLFRCSLHVLRQIPSFSQPLIRHLVRPYN